MANTKTLSNNIYYNRNHGEISMATANKRIRGGELIRSIILKQAVRMRQITSHQALWVEVVWGNTIAQRNGQWSISAARNIQKHTAALAKPIFAETRGRRLSGRIYYDCADEGAIEYLAHAAFQATSLFQSFGTTSHLKPLQFEKDKQIIKAIVYGLFTRPRMAGYIKTSVEEGLTIEPAPRCASEDLLRDIQLRQHNAQRVIHEEAIAHQRAVSLFKRILPAFIAYSNTQKQITQMATVDDWESLCEE